MPGADGYYKVADSAPLLKPKPTLSPVSYGRRMAYACIGILFGVCAAVVFSGAIEQFKNVWAAALGAGSGIMAFITFHEHRRHRNAESAGVAVENYNVPLRVVAILGGCVGIAGFLGFLTAGIFEKEKVTVGSMYVSAVWGFLLAKWGVILLFYVNSYSRRDEIRAELGVDQGPKNLYERA